MELDQTSMREFVAIAAGSPRYRVKYMPTATLRPELHTETCREIALFCLADDTDTFILHNRWVGGDDWNEELAEYTAEIWETVVLRSSADMFENIATGPDSTLRLEWSNGVIAWNTAEVELLLHDGNPVTFAVGGALSYTTSLDGTPHEFLVGLEFTGPVDEWRLKRSGTGPGGFALARREPTSRASA